MIYDWDAFKPKLKTCPLGPDNGYVLTTLQEPTNGLPAGTPITIKLITSFDGLTWWAFVYEVQKFVIVDIAQQRPPDSRETSSSYGEVK